MFIAWDLLLSRIITHRNIQALIMTVLVLNVLLNLYHVVAVHALVK